MRRILLLAPLLAFWALPMRAQEDKPAGPKPTRVEVTPRVTEAQVGQQRTFSATGYDEAGNKLDVKPTAWFATPFDLAYSDDEGVVTAIASVDDSGFATGAAPGAISWQYKPRKAARGGTRASCCRSSP